MRNRVMIVVRYASLAFFIAVLSLSSQAQAQSEKPLYKIKEFGLDIYGFDEDGKACGVFEAVIKLVTSTYGKMMPFKLVDTVEQHSLLTFMVDTFRTKDRCITHIYTQATYSVIARLPNSREDDLARIELWSAADFVVTEHDPKVHRVEVGRAVLQQMLKMAKEWREQNATRL